MKKRAKTESKSLGTIIAEKARARANAYTDEQRSALLEQGMALIYGAPGNAKSTAPRR